jgi:DNA-binding CsgD family transcriptional regulator
VAEVITAWPGVPPEAAEPMLPLMRSTADQMTFAIRREVPAFGESGATGSGTSEHCLREAVLQAVRHFVWRIADPELPRLEITEFFRGIGREQAAAGLDVESVQAAFRVGARVAWRALHERVEWSSLGADVPARLGEAIFLYLDELAAACAEGAALARAAAAGQARCRRQDLAGLIVADPPGPAAAVAGLARECGWQLPRKVAIAALGTAGQQAGPLSALPAEFLADLSGPEPYAVVPDPEGPGRAELIAGCLRGRLAALGPAVPLAAASSSLRWARQALALGCRGIVAADHGLIRCADNVPALLLLADEELLRVTSAARLSPLTRLRPAQRETTAETLLCWLQSGGNAKETARQLHVHPQTIRYRLRQIREMFGTELLESEARFELEVALRARRLLRCEQPRQPQPRHHAASQAVPAGRDGSLARRTLPRHRPAATVSATSDTATANWPQAGRAPLAGLRSPASPGKAPIAGLRSPGSTGQRRDRDP